MVCELTCHRAFVRSPLNFVRSLWTSWGSKVIKSFSKCPMVFEIGGAKVGVHSYFSQQKAKLLQPVKLVLLRSTFNVHALNLVLTRSLGRDGQKSQSVAEALKRTGKPPSWIESTFLADFGHFAPMVCERTCQRALMGSPSNFVRSLWTSWGSKGIKIFSLSITANKKKGGKVGENHDSS